MHDWNAMREYFNSGATRDARRRRELLFKLERELVARRERFVAALAEDLGKAPVETLMTEFLPALTAIRMLRRKLLRWSRPRRAATSLLNFPSRGWLVPEPFGLALVISTWNYPLLLALEPLAGAIAAGNCAVLVPAPPSHATGAELAELIKACFPPEHATVIHGHPNELARQDFDYIFFTGGSRAGAKIAAIAGERLIPATLELGGKSPCIVTEHADLKLAARRIAWGKFINAGQTCVAPDYLVVAPRIKDELMRRLRDAIRDFYGDNPQESADYGRIVNGVHFERLSRLLAEGRLIAGGERDERDRYIAPSIVDQVGWDSPVMAEEIFGPILPVLELESLEQTLETIRRRPRPLALYLFSASRREQELVVTATSSGAVAINDTVMQMANPSMPFGGVGASGYGAYHGRRTFETFCHLKPVMKRANFLDWPLRYPPFDRFREKLLRFLCR